jgi:hypothetical protein
MQDHLYYVGHQSMMQLASDEELRWQQLRANSHKERMFAGIDRYLYI